MNLELIKQEAESFFDWPSGKRTHITYMSCLLFARHCVEKSNGWRPIADAPKVREIHSVDANTFVHWCHSVKAHDSDAEAVCMACGWTGTRQDLVKQEGQQ